MYIEQIIIIQLEHKVSIQAEEGRGRQ